MLSKCQLLLIIFVVGILIYNDFLDSSAETQQLKYLVSGAALLLLLCILRGHQSKVFTGMAEITKEKLDILREADHIFMEELKAAKLYNKVSQAFAVFLPIKSVGVVGDARRYEYVIALRAAETIDFMTAKASQLNHNLLNKVSDRIINEIPKVSRVVYDISSKPPATIEWE